MYMYECDRGQVDSGSPEKKDKNRCMQQARSAFLDVARYNTVPSRMGLRFTARRNEIHTMLAAARCLSAASTSLCQEPRECGGHRHASRNIALLDCSLAQPRGKERL